MIKSLIKVEDDKHYLYSIDGRFVVETLTTYKYRTKRFLRKEEISEEGIRHKTNLSELDQDSTLFKVFIGRPLYDILVDLENKKFTPEFSPRGLVLTHTTLPLRLVIGGSNKEYSLTPRKALVEYESQGSVQCWELPCQALTALLQFKASVWSELERARHRAEQEQKERQRNEIIAIFDGGSEWQTFVDSAQ